MSTIYLDKLDATLARAKAATFPGAANKNKIQILDPDYKLNLNSYWSGGSKDAYAVLDIVTMKTVSIPQNGSEYEKTDLSEVPDTKLPENTIIIKHSIFRGKDMGLTFMVPAHMAAPLLPAPPSFDLTDKEKTVLAATSAFTSSYRKEFLARKMSAADVTTAKAKLMDLGLLTKIGAITPSGRNAVAAFKAHNPELM